MELNSCMDSPNMENIALCQIECMQLLIGHCGQLFTGQWIWPNKANSDQNCRWIGIHLGVNKLELKENGEDKLKKIEIGK